MYAWHSKQRMCSSRCTRVQGTSSSSWKCLSFKLPVNSLTFSFLLWLYLSSHLFISNPKSETPVQNPTVNFEKLQLECVSLCFALTFSAVTGLYGSYRAAGHPVTAPHPSCLPAITSSSVVFWMFFLSQYFGVRST